MNTSELKKKTEKDLMKTLAEKREALRAFRFGEAGSRSRNVKEGHELKRAIAKILTELTARGLAQNKENA